MLGRHELTRAGLIQSLSYDSDRASVVAGPIRGGDPGSHDVVVFDLTGRAGTAQNDLATLLANGEPQLAEAALAMGVAETVRPEIDAPGLLQAFERAAAGHSTTPLARRRQEDCSGRLLPDGSQNGDPRAHRERPPAQPGHRRTALPDVNTVKSHIRSTYRKIGVTRRAEAVLWAVGHDLTGSGRNGIE